jgi:hypothetical protein
MIIGYILSRMGNTLNFMIWCIDKLHSSSLESCETMDTNVLCTAELRHISENENITSRSHFKRILPNMSHFKTVFDIQEHDTLFYVDDRRRTCVLNTTQDYEAMYMMIRMRNITDFDLIIERRALIQP